jgi:hypothetical protein
MDRGCRNRSSFDEMVALVVLLRQQSLCFSYLHAIERQQGRWEAWEAINDALDMASARMGARPADRRRHRQSIGENLRKRGPRGFDSGKKIISRRRHIVTPCRRPPTARRSPCLRSARPIPGCAKSSPTAVMPAPNSSRPSPDRSTGPSKSSNAQRNQQLRAHRAPMGGRVVERTLAWLGAVAASPKTSKPRSRALSHGSLSPISGA